MSRGGRGVSVPRSVRAIPFRELVTLSQNGLSKRHGDMGVGVSVLRLADLRDGVFQPTEPRVIRLTPSERAKYSLSRGDLVCIRVNGSEKLVGRILPWRAPSEWSFCDHFIRFKLAADLADPDYVALYFNTSPVRYHIETSFVSSAGQKTVNQRILGDIPIPLPPLPEQRRIVAKLDRLSARSRAAREHLDRVAKLAARAKQAVLAAAFRGELTADWRQRHAVAQTAAALVDDTPAPSQSRGGREATIDVIEGVGGLSVNDPGTPLPEGWAWIRLRRIARQETGHTPSRSRPDWWGGDIPWIGIRDANAHHGAVIEDTLQNTNPEGLANSSARLLPAGTVCLSRTASVGYVTMMGRPMATSQDFATWTCSSALDPWYLMFALMSEGDEIRRFGEGTTHTTIYFPEIRALHIKLAPLPEQREIVRRVRSALEAIDRMVVEAGRAHGLLDRLDERLLAKAFRGELVPQDPSDEPAEALLARVRAGRAVAPVRRRGRRVGAS